MVQDMADDHTDNAREPARKQAASEPVEILGWTDRQGDATASGEAELPSAEPMASSDAAVSAPLAGSTAQGATAKEGAPAGGPQDETLGTVRPAGPLRRGGGSVGGSTAWSGIPNDFDASEVGVEVGPGSQRLLSPRPGELASTGASLNTSPAPPQRSASEASLASRTTTAYLRTLDESLTWAFPAPSDQTGAGEGAPHVG